MEKVIEQRRRVGSYICWGCHMEFPLYEGQKRRYCPVCSLKRQRELAGRRHNKKAERETKLRDGDGNRAS